MSDNGFRKETVSLSNTGSITIFKMDSKLFVNRLATGFISFVTLTLFGAFMYAIFA